MYKVKAIKGLEEYEKFLEELNGIGAEIVDVSSASEKIFNLKCNGVEWSFIVTYKVKNEMPNVINIKEKQMILEEEAI